MGPQVTMIYRVALSNCIDMLLPWEINLSTCVRSIKILYFFGVCCITLSILIYIPTLVWFSPARLLCTWDSPGKNTGVGCHFLLGDLPNPGIKPRSPALQAESLPTELQRKPTSNLIFVIPFRWHIIHNRFSCKS